MSEAAVIERVVTQQVRTPPEPLRHRVCICQQPLEPGRAFCGVKVGGRGEPIQRFKPMDLCVICQTIAESARPCPHCGKQPSL